MRATLCFINMWAVLATEHPREFTASSCCFITHMPLLLFKSQTTKKKDGSREFPEGRNILVSISRGKQSDRGHRNKSILWVPTENWAIVRRFHFTASFRIIIRRPPSALFPHQLPWFHTGERWKTKTETHLRHIFEVFNFYKDFYSHIKYV